MSMGKGMLSCLHITDVNCTRGQASAGNARRWEGGLQTLLWEHVRHSPIRNRQRSLTFAGKSSMTLTKSWQRCAKGLFIESAFRLA